MDFCQMQKVAFCLSGAVSKVSGNFNKQGELYNNSQYVNYKLCFDTIEKYILYPNIKYSFDFYIHSWSFDLKENLNNLYRPINSLYEDNKNYNNEINSNISKPEFFSAASRALSIKKSIELINNLSFYDKVIIYRPDLYLNKVINLNNYNLNKIYVNKFDKCNGDFHFIMNSNLANKFKNLYDSAKINNPENHVWIKRYVLFHLNEEIIEDDIIAGVDQEIIRKLNFGKIYG